MNSLKGKPGTGRILIVTLVVLILPAGATAKYGGGTGTAEDPYLVATPEDLNNIGNHKEDWDRHFKLMADIDLSAYREDEFNIIGDSSLWFCGSFDGGGHRIFNFNYRSVDRDNIGLFGWVWDMYGPGVIKDLGLVNAYIHADSGSFVGGLIGSFWGGTVTGCYTRGGTIIGKDIVGGLVGGCVLGSADGSLIDWIPPAKISQCYTSCSVIGNAYIGGLVGINTHEVSNCYSITGVYAESWAGGLVGENFGTISNCYAAGHVWAGAESGGLVGIGSPDGVTNSFWDLEVSGLQVSAGGVPRTKAEMKMADTYLSAGWDFVSENENGTNDIWKLCEAIDYPHLVWEKYGGGGGTITDPYKIYTAEQFRAIGEEPNDWDEHFKLMADIDLAGLGQDVRVIGNEEMPFTGTFDGDGKTISGFSYSPAYGDRIGLFGYVKGSGAKIENLGLISPNISAGIACHVGALVGYLELADLVGCYVQGGSVSGNQDTGGLVGHNWGDISDCHSSCEVLGTDKVGGLIGTNDRHVTNSSSVGPVHGDNMVGGLVGYNTQSNVACCYSMGAVSAVSRAGGLAGQNKGMIKNCYAMGDVSGQETIGGFLGVAEFGDAAIWNCYSTGRVTAERHAGGFTAAGTVETYSCFWDVEASGQSESHLGTGKTTVQMHKASTFAGWGCDSAWTIDEGADYPRLRWENMPGQLIATPSFQDIAGSGTTDDPYMIHTAEQLNQIGLFPVEWNKHYSLQENIDLSCLVSETFNIIGSQHVSFTGVFDGNGHTISNFSSSKYRDCLGLFGRISHPAVVKSVILVNPSIEMKAPFYAGALVGHQYRGTISRCGVEGGSVRGKRLVGGLVGCSSGTITQCYATCNVSGDMEVGGLVGDASRANITDCYATGDVSAESEQAGGLVGSSYVVSIRNCYSTGQVKASTTFGGLVGRPILTDSEGCLWDTQTSGCQSSAVGIGRSTTYMQRALTFMIAGWDFVWEDIVGTDDMWCICEGQDYPKLTWQFTVGDFDGDGDVDFGDYRLFASRWHDTDGSFWCGVGGTDFTYDGYVDFVDLVEFAENWLAGTP